MRRHRSKPRSTNRPGAVLLLALLMMGTVTATTIGFAVFITSDFQQSQATEQYMGATYAVDAGIERALAIVAAARKQETLNAAITALNATNLPVSSRQTVSVSGSEATSNPIVNLDVGDSYVVDIQKDSGGNLPDTLRIDADAASLNKDLIVQWTVINGQGTAGQGRVSIPDASTVTDINLQNVYSEDSNTAGPFTGTSTLGYRVTIFNADLTPITNISISAFRSGAGVPIYSTIQIDATAAAGSAQARKSVTLLWQQPSSQAFGYVLYTEGDIKPAE